MRSFESQLLISKPTHVYIPKFQGNEIQRYRCRICSWHRQASDGMFTSCLSCRRKKSSLFRIMNMVRRISHLDKICFVCVFRRGVVGKFSKICASQSFTVRGKSKRQDSRPDRRTLLLDDLLALIFQLQENVFGHQLRLLRFQQCFHSSLRRNLPQSWSATFQVIQIFHAQLSANPGPIHLNWIEIWRAPRHM